MSEAAFFYNLTTQRPVRPKPPSVHTDSAAGSQVQLLKSAAKKSKWSPKKSCPPKQNTSQHSVAASTSTSSTTSTTSSVAPELNERHDPMLSTPLPDYRHAANQTLKGRAAAQAASGKTPSSGITAADRKHALQVAAEQKARAAAARGDTLGRTSSISSNTASSGITAVTSDAASTDDLGARPFTRGTGVDTYETRISLIHYHAISPRFTDRPCAPCCSVRSLVAPSAHQLSSRIHQNVSLR